MSAFGPHSLGAACRAIYVQAAEDNILPPLIRDAADPSPPQRRLEAAGLDFSLVLRVVYDEPPRAASGRLERPPFRFEIEATTGPDDRPAELSAAERFELIRAFLLGVREPLMVEAPADGGDWRLAFKVSSRFAMWEAEPIRLDVGLSADEICQRLAGRLLETTQSLFSSRAVGLAVWEARLREELFAEARACAHDIWPIVQPVMLPALSALSAPQTIPHCRRTSAAWPRRRGMAAVLACIGLAALAGVLASRARNSDPMRIGPQDVKLSEAQVGGPESGSRIDGASPASLRMVALSDMSARSAPAAADVRLATLAPAVAEATRAMSPASISQVAWTPGPQVPGVAGENASNAPDRKDHAPTRISPPGEARAAAGAGHRKVAHLARRATRTNPIVRVDRAVRKFFRSVARRLPRTKISALNSPHAAGPRLR